MSRPGQFSAARANSLRAVRTPGRQYRRQARYTALVPIRRGPAKTSTKSTCPGDRSGRAPGEAESTIAQTLPPRLAIRANVAGGRVAPLALVTGIPKVRIFVA